MRLGSVPLVAAVLMALQGAAASEAWRFPPLPPYLQNGQPGAITIAWRSADTGPAVATVTEELGTRRLTGRIEPGDAAEMRFEGLTPGAHYRYRVVQRGKVLGTGRFKANPGPEQGHFRFAVLGDMGTGVPGQFAIAERVTAWKPDFTLAVGDLIYPHGAWHHYKPRFFKPYRELLRNSVVYPALGNHDVETQNGAPYLTAFSLPKAPGDERYYAFDYGPARFWALDTTQPFHPGSPQYAWFARDAAASKARWKFAFFHHPPYSSGLHGSHPAVRAHLSPLFARHGFAAVFAGHDHHYERTEPIDGVTYIVSGGGGGMLYGILPKRFTAAYAQFKHSYVGVTVYGDTLAIRAFDEQGQTLDSWATQRRRAE